MKTFSGICPACGFVSVSSDTAPKLCRNMIEVEPRQFRPCAKRLEEVALVRGLPKAMDARAPAGPARDLAATCRELVRVLETVGAPVAGLLDFDRLHAWARAFSPATVTIVPHLDGFPPPPPSLDRDPGEDVMSRPALTVCQGDMLVRLDKGTYFLAGAFKPKERAARKAVVDHLFKAGLVVPARGPAQWAINDAGRDALAVWREANKELLDKRRREFWAKLRLMQNNDKNEGACDVVS